MNDRLRANVLHFRVSKNHNQNVDDYKIERESLSHDRLSSRINLIIFNHSCAIHRVTFHWPFIKRCTISHVDLSASNNAKLIIKNSLDAWKLLE